MFVYPNENTSVLKFEAQYKQHPIRFYLVCDFESFLVPSKDSYADRRTRTIDRHGVSGFCCYRVTPYEQYQTPPIVYSGPDPISKFYDHVISESHLNDQIMSHHVSIKPSTSQQEAEFRTATVCRKFATATSHFFHTTTKWNTTIIWSVSFFSPHAVIAICNWSSQNVDVQTTSARL